ncbi:MAG: ImmA/IrrE family metallo-endopeptidase [Minwuiales bacterium]|nr:ImmA/IrrE family metallo-endopeptidase [Minwuiales bacterium]
MTKSRSPQRWANDLTLLLNATHTADRFPVNVELVAREFSHQRFPDDPLTMIKGAALPGFDGALLRAPAGKQGWGIVYNNDIASVGRINFTLGHEFGHYLLHRLSHPEGIKCSQDDVVHWESEYGQIEHEANVFAATLLMPFDDFRRQIDAQTKPDLSDISHCADRYQVSLIAATLRWLQYTQRRAVLVVSRDDFILWARSSEPAFKSGRYFRTANRPPLPIPQTSLAAQRSLIEGSKAMVELPAGTWFPEPCEEMTVFSDQYDFTISLLHLDNAASQFYFETKEDEQDLFDRMKGRTPGSSWLG